LPSPQSAQVIHVEIAAHDARPWNECLKALGFAPGARFSDTGISGRYCCRDLARVKISEVTGPADGALSPAAEHLSRHGEGVAEVRLGVPDVAQARMRAIAARAKTLSGLMRRVEEDSSGMIEATRVGGVGVQHWLLSTTGPVAETPTRHQEASIDYMVLAVDGADLSSTARFYIRAFGMDLLCAQQVQAGEETIRSVALGGTGWTLVIAAQEPSGAPGIVSAFLQSHGAGIGHIAFRVPDILATVSQATAGGVEFLPIPTAHFDSVPASLGYTPANLGELQRGHVAVGRAGDGGVAYHATTGPVSPRSQLTLGLVQRTAGTPVISRDAVTALAAARAAAASNNGR
jgi:4-hydroxyphenylpyruvate dioxygenase-like putative hemolysin